MRSSFIALLVLALASIAFTQESKPQAEPAAKASQSKEIWQGEPYLLTTCAASGRPIEVKGTPQTAFFEGRELKFCCKGCADFVKKSPDKFLAKVDEQLIAQQAPIYPTDQCLVAGTPLTKDGKDVGTDVMIGNRLFRVCCGKCAAKVKADPAAFAAKLDAMVLKRAETSYPMETCVVNAKRKLDERSRSFVVAGRPVKACCSGCERKVRSKPMDFLPKIDKALADARAKDEKPTAEAKQDAGK